MTFVSLHTHTTFSYGDGFGPVAAHADRLVELGYWAGGSSEHGNNSVHAHQEMEFKKRGLKPIYGCELYTAPTDPNGLLGEPLRTRKKFHQTVFAANEVGYRNLNRIVSASWRDFFFQWPTTPSGLLREHSEGLVVLSGCADSLLSCTLLGGKELGEKRTTYSRRDFQNAVEVVKRYQDVFGDRYYIEVQRFPGLERARILNPAFGEIAELTGARLVATADVHYPYPEDNKMQRILHAAHRGGTVESVDATWEYDILLTYPTSDEEIITDLIGTGLTRAQAEQSVAETSRIAEYCTVELPKNEPIKFPYPGSGLKGEDKTWSGKNERAVKDLLTGVLEQVRYESIEQYIWSKLRDGWRFRAKKNPRLGQREWKQQYTDRLNYEMEQISAKGFLHYFGMLSDSVIWAKDHKIPVGPARGSAAASLACYLLRITEVDPMQFPHMLFARFIDPNRLDLPDVDLDFSDDRRDEVRQYLVSVYGADRVGNIGNFTRYKGKNSIDDVARVYRIPKWAAKRVKELIVERSGGDARQSNSLEDTFEMFEKARDILKQYPQLVLACELEGNYRGLGVHAAGLVISNEPITETCAVYTRPKANSDTTVTVVAYDKKGAEYLGMLKMDYLGLSTMGMIDIALNIIGMDLEDLYAVPIDESKTMQAFTNSDLAGIFQFEGRATATVNADVIPDHFGHLADINALSRPGPLFSGMTADYIKVKHGREPMKRLHPVVDELTGWTYGQIVYQEQVLSIVKDLAGFPIERVGDIRRIISQKLGNMVMANALEEFIEGCRTTHQVRPELAREIWNYIATSSTYSFNQSHSVSYSLLAFWCMYLKQYHPTAFYAAQLTKVGDGKDQLDRRGRLMRDAIKGREALNRLPVLIAPPEVLSSGKGWAADLDRRMAIAGLTQVHGIGDITADNIIAYRNNMAALEPDKPIEWGDLINVSGIGPATIKKIENFIEDEDPFEILKTENFLNLVREDIELGVNGMDELPFPTHTSMDMPKTGTHNVVWIGLARSINFKDYVEATRTRTGHDEADIIKGMRDPHLRNSCVIRAYDEGPEDVYLRISRWDFPRMASGLANIVKDLDIIMVRGKKREDDFGISIHVKNIYIIDGQDYQ